MNLDAGLTAEPNSHNGLRPFDTMVEPENNDNSEERSFQIPRHSFTAFRLRYSSAEMVSKSSQTFLLGAIPEAWVRSRKSLVVKLSHRTRVKNKFKAMNDKLIALNDEFFENPLRTTMDSTDSNSEDISSFSTFNKIPSHFDQGKKSNVKRSFPTSEFRSMESTGEGLNASQIRNSGDSSTNSFNDLISSDVTMKDEVERPLENEKVRSSLVESLYNEIYQGQQQKQIRYDEKSPFSIALLPKSETNQDDQSTVSFHSAQSSFSDETNSFYPQGQPSNIEAKQTVLLKVPKELLTESVSVFSAFSSDGLQGKGTVKFSVEDPREARRRSVIKKVDPNPLSSVEFVEQHSPIENVDWKMIKRLKKGAFNSKHRIATELEEIEKRLRVSQLLKAFEIGEILKLEKMLVLVKQTNSCSIKKNLTDDECFDTRVYERWKEYIVVARSNSDPDNPVFIQFKNKRHIDRKEEYKLHGLDFKLNIHTSAVSFYSPLDKTISISIPGRKENERFFYILRTHTQSSALSWNSFLNDIISINSQNIFKLTVPDIQTSLNIRVPWDDLDEQLDDLIKHKNSLYTITYKGTGYQVERPQEIQYIVNLIDRKLVNSCLFESKKTEWLDIKNSLCFVWKSFDRLEWVSHENGMRVIDMISMMLSHTLELRKQIHYPTTVESTSETILFEPTPVEGFLGRLSTRSGNSRSGVLQRQVFKLEYYYTQENLLMFCSGRNGVPPLPDKTLIDLDGSVSDTELLRNLMRTLPSVFHNNHFELDDHKHILWLNPDMTSSDFHKKDLEGLYEFERRSLQVIHSSGVVDMCDIKKIKSINHENVSKIVKTASSLLWTGSVAHASDKAITDGCFEIELISGGSVKLQAPSKIIKEEWMRRLSLLSVYWKLRKNKDKWDLMLLKEQNEESLKLRDFDVAAVASKQDWESNRAIANPNIFNISDIALSKSILMSGELYEKPKKHSNFKKFFAVLSPGNITLFNMFRRSVNGSIKRTCGYRHYLTIAIHEAYVYSGTNSSLELLEKNDGMDHMHPTDLSEPRAYDDGWVSSETQKDRSFTLWFGTKRAIAGDNHESSKLVKHSAFNGPHKLNEADLSQSDPSSVMNPGFVRIVSRLGVTGKSIMFIARSREERDLWVTRISNSIEKFFTSDDEEIKLS